MSTPPEGPNCPVSPELRIFRSSTTLHPTAPAARPLLNQFKVAANKRDVPYQSLIKVWLAEKVRAE